MPTSNETEVKVPLIRNEPQTACAVAPFPEDVWQLGEGIPAVACTTVPPTTVMFVPLRAVAVALGVVKVILDQACELPLYPPQPANEIIGLVTGCE